MIPFISPGCQSHVRRILANKYHFGITITRNCCCIYRRTGAVLCFGHFHPSLLSLICIRHPHSKPSTSIIPPTLTRFHIHHFLPLSIERDIAGDVGNSRSGIISISITICAGVPTGKRPTCTSKTICPQGLRTVTGNSRVACRTTTRITVTLEGNGISRRCEGPRRESR